MVDAKNVRSVQRKAKRDAKESAKKAAQKASTTTRSRGQAELVRSYSNTLYRTSGPGTMVDARKGAITAAKAQRKRMAETRVSERAAKRGKTPPVETPKKEPRKVATNQRRSQRSGSTARQGARKLAQNKGYWEKQDRRGNSGNKSTAPSSSSSGTKRPSRTSARQGARNLAQNKEYWEKTDRKGSKTGGTRKQTRSTPKKTTAKTSKKRSTAQSAKKTLPRTPGQTNAKVTAAEIKRGAKGTSNIKLKQKPLPSSTARATAEKNKARIDRGYEKNIAKPERERKRNERRAARRNPPTTNSGKSLPNPNPNANAKSTPKTEVKKPQAINRNMTPNKPPSGNTGTKLTRGVGKVGRFALGPKGAAVATAAGVGTGIGLKLNEASGDEANKNRSEALKGPVRSIYNLVTGRDTAADNAALARTKDRVAARNTKNNPINKVDTGIDAKAVVDRAHKNTGSFNVTKNPGVQGGSKSTKVTKTGGSSPKSRSRGNGGQGQMYNVDGKTMNKADYKAHRAQLHASRKAAAFAKTKTGRAQAAQQNKGPAQQYRKEADSVHRKHAVGNESRQMPWTNRSEVNSTLQSQANAKAEKRGRQREWLRNFVNN